MAIVVFLAVAVEGHSRGRVVEHSLAGMGDCTVSQAVASNLSDTMVLAQGLV